MKKYLIKDILVSTEKNNSFPNKTIIYYCGKEGANTAGDENDIKRIAKWYGYSTKASAAAGLRKWKDLADWETAQGFWKHISTEIVEVEI